MERSGTQILWRGILSVSLLAWTASAQITPSADSYTNTATPITNYGAKTLLDVDGASQITYLQFNLASIPSGASVSQATLKLYVNSVTTAGSFNADYVNSSWSESTIDASNAPPIGTTISSNVNVTTADKNQYILINVTSAVQAWLSGAETNYGLALVANSTFNATFDSKENTGTSHAPELDVVFEAVQAINTASGSGLTGGGSGGTLNLSLTHACAANQLLKWNGSEWACSNAATGTVSSVGLRAPSSDFTVSSSPVTGSGTLGLNWTVAPTNAATANAIVKRDGSGNIQVGSVFATSSSHVPIDGEDTYGDTTSAGVYGVSTNGTGVHGASINGIGVAGTAPTGVYASGVTYGVYAQASNGDGVAAYSAGTNDSGIYGNASGSNGHGVYGLSSASGGYGVYGAAAASSYGVYGRATSGWGVYGTVASSGYGVFGTVTSSGTDGVHGESYSENSGVAGLNFNGTSGYGVYGQAFSSGSIGGGFYNFAGGYAGYFGGNVEVNGNLSKAGGSFKIDHPLDPANKYLYHSFVESPDMKDIYDGVAALDANGEATVEMPDWFGALNRDFRYQLTCIGGFAPIYIAEKLANNQFKIGGGRAGMEVSWQITGVRQDPWANAHRIPVEEEKEAKLKGFYLHPELYGAPAEKGIEWARHPEMMKKLQQTREQMKEKQAWLTESAALPQGSPK